MTHVYPLGLQVPKGRLQSSQTDSGNLSIRPVPLSGRFRKYSASRRFVAHRRYARDLKHILSRESFDVVLSGNTPIDVQAELLWHCRSNEVGFVHWVQDVYCRALEFYLRRKVGALAAAASAPFQKLEQLVASHSDATVVIARGFRKLLLAWGIPPDKITVVENWAPLDEVDVLPRANPWSEKHSLTADTVFLYSGTLGLKHRPDLLYKLAQSLGSRAKVVVITEGVGREYLEKLPKLDNLLLLGFQPYDDLPRVLATADVLLATLETDAGEFAVPSKILTYLCAGRPLLLAAPRDNLAASVVERSGAGFAVSPDNPDEWLAAASRLAENASVRRGLGVRARQYAEQQFDISRIAATFEQILNRACVRPVVRPIPSPGIQPEL